MRAKELEGKGRQDDAGMDKIACVLLGDLRQIAWIIRTCKWMLKVFVENCRVCQPGQACSATGRDAVERRLGRCLQSRVLHGNSSQRKAKRVRARSAIRRLMYGRLRRRGGRSGSACNFRAHTRLGERRPASDAFGSRAGRN